MTATDHEKLGRPTARDWLSRLIRTLPDRRLLMAFGFGLAVSAIIYLVYLSIGRIWITTLVAMGIFLIAYCGAMLGMQQLEVTASSKLRNAIEQDHERVKHAFLRDLVQLKSNYRLVALFLEGRKRNTQGVSFFSIVGRSAYLLFLSKSIFVAVSLLIGMLLAIHSIGGSFLTIRQIARMTEQNELLTIELKNSSAQVELVTTQNNLLDEQNQLVRGQTATEIANRISGYRQQLDQVIELLQDEASPVRNNAYRRLGPLVSRLTPYYIPNDDGVIDAERLSPERGYVFEVLSRQNRDNKDRPEYIIDLTPVVFTYAQLAKADLEGIEVGPRLRLSRSDLYRANLTDSTLNEVIINDARAIETDFRRAKLNRANFMGTDATRAIFSEAQLIEARLDASTLVGADFRRANLRNTSFEFADLRGANFANAEGLDSVLFGHARVSENWNMSWSQQYSLVAFEDHFELIAKTPDALAK